MSAQPPPYDEGKQGYPPPQQGYPPPQQGYPPPQQGYPPPQQGYPPPQAPGVVVVQAAAPVPQQVIITSTIHERPRVNHCLHCVISLFFFPWLLVWLCLCICA